ncbi:MAG: hypothetical protein HJJLKODD_02008 [Phycisphaerae bacterium]|nr:hypothetical protein [Phycisphaerae bacterium]
MMRRLLICSMIGVGLFTMTVSAQESQPTSPLEQMVTTSTAPSQPTTEQADELANWVAIIKNNNVAIDQRVFSARKLIAQDWPAAQAVAVELLEIADHPGARLAICRALAQNGAPAEIYLEPLLRSLQDSNVELRTEAGIALARYNDPMVAERLMALVQDNALATETRQAALLPFGRMLDSQRACSLLIPLLSERDGAIDGALYTALRQACGVDLGTEADKWLTWWDANGTLSSEDWLRRKLEICQQQLETQRLNLERINDRLIRSLEQIYTLTAVTERTERLKNFLADPQETVRLLALRLIQTNIGEGQLPSPELTELIRQKLEDPAAAVRIGVLTILGHLRESGDALKVVAALERETDNSVRLAAIDTLGKLGSVDANGPLLIILQQSDPAESAAAARALGRINARGKVAPEQQAAIVTALKTKFDQLADQNEAQAAVLVAMSSIGTAEAAPYLLKNLQHPQAEIRVRCVAGLTGIGDAGYLSAITPLLTDSSAAVRRESALGIGMLGSSDADLQNLYNRLGKDVETDSTVREALWNSFDKIRLTRDNDQQLAWIMKLAEYPNEQIERLKELENRLQNMAPPPASLNEVRMTLAKQYERVQRFNEAARYWELVEHDALIDSSAAAQEAAWQRWRMLLRAKRYAPAINQAERIMQLQGEAMVQTIQTELLAYLGECLAGNQMTEAAQLLEMLASDLPQVMTNEFVTRLEPFRELTSQPATNPTAQKAPRISR